MARRRDLLALTRLAREVLQLEDWDITVRFNDRMRDTAQCDAKPEYSDATITYRARKIPSDMALRFAIHEAAHCHVEPLAAYALALCGDDPVKRKVCSDLEEALTTKIEHIVCGLLEQMKGTRSSKPAP